MATRDEVTGLHNRPFFVESLRHAMAQAQRFGHGLALYFIDVDRFKIVNDSLGHLVGDRVLRELGASIAGAMRASDIVARLGGDEFVVLVEGVRTRDSLREVAQKIVRAGSQPVRAEGRELALSVSVGVALAPDDGRDGHTLMRNADIAMYRAKAQGRGGYSFYLPEMSAESDERLSIVSELAHAVERGEMRVYFQAQADVATGKIAGAEALLRWQHPRHGLIGPDKFIDVAEETGAIVGIGAWVLGRACHAAAEWTRLYGLPLRIAVNLSARQFSEPSLMADVEAALTASALPPNLLELEITESAVMSDPEEAATLMRRLRERGVRIAMDDFGTGYSSLGYLKQFPLNAVKIDHSFIKGLPERDDDAAIARAVLAMAGALELEVIAEGVERPEQLEFLVRERCGQYQGYLYSVPLPEAEMRMFISKAISADGNAVPTLASPPAAA